jgi:hypothetical protein
MEINGIKYTLPKSWSDINVKTYLELVKVIDKEFENDITKTVYILSALTGIPVEDILKNEVSYFIDIQRKLTFLNFMPSTEVLEKFTIDGVTYQTVTNPHLITTGEFIDLNGLTSDNDKIYENIPSLLAVFYRPVIDGKRTKEYSVMDVEERKKIFLEKLSVDKVFGCTSFFLGLKLIYLNLISQSFSKRMKKM